MACCGIGSRGGSPRNWPEVVYEKGIVLQITLLPRELRAKGIKYESKGRRPAALCISVDVCNSYIPITIRSIAIITTIILMIPLLTVITIAYPCFGKLPCIMSSVSLLPPTISAALISLLARGSSRGNDC